MSSTNNDESRSNNDENTPEDPDDRNDVTRFQSKYLYRPKVIPVKYETQANSKIVIFGLQEGSGIKVFDDFFNSEYSEETIIAKYDENVEIKVKVLSSYFETEPSKVLVNPSQCNTHLLTLTAYEVLEQLRSGLSCFVVVFDANFHRFSSDCDEALHLLEKCFGPSIWDFTTFVIVNADQVLENKTTEEYLNEEKDSRMWHWASKMGNGVFALPSSNDEYSKEFIKKEVASIIRTSASSYNPDFYRKLRWWCYGVYHEFKKIIGL